MSSLETYSISLNDYLNQYLSYIREPIVRLQLQRSELEVKYAVFTDLKSKLDALDSAIEKLSVSGTTSVFRAKAATSSDGTVVACVATSAAAPGSHTVSVTQLAKAHTVVSDRYDQDGTSLSESHSGVKTFSITVEGETYEISVTISDGEANDTVLSNIALAINDTTGGQVTSSMVMDTPSTCKLSIRSGSTGAAGTMAFVDTDGLLASLGVSNQSQATDTVGGYVYADLGNNEIDALLTVDGINIISNTNIVDNALTGLTLTLLGQQEAGDTPVTLTVSVDVESIKSGIQDFLSAYNDAFTYLVEKTRIDGSTYERAVLSGDFPYISLRANMRQTMNTWMRDSGFDYEALSQIGITSNRAGSFAISDEDLIEEVIASDTEAIENLFASDNGIAVTFGSLISRYTEVGGTISLGQDGLNSRMETIDGRIDRQESYLSLREQELRKQYAALQEALYTLEMTRQITSSFASLVGL